MSLKYSNLKTLDEENAATHYWSWKHHRVDYLNCAGVFLVYAALVFCTIALQRSAYPPAQVGIQKFDVKKVREHVNILGKSERAMPSPENWNARAYILNASQALVRQSKRSYFNSTAQVLEHNDMVSLQGWSYHYFSTKYLAWSLR
jgi:hypothetical protein